MMHKAFFLPESPANPDSLPFDREHPWLAPLAGYSDLPFRLLCRQYGAAVCVTEMVSAKGLVYRSPGTGELLQSLPEDQPLVVQLFGAEASFLQRAVEMLRDVGYGWFDLNMGCSVAKVLKQGAGAAMLGDVPNALEVARAMLQAAGPGRVGFKIRLGLDSQRHVWRDLSLRLQDLGAGWITLHPRTARQGFGGEAALGGERDLEAARVLGAAPFYKFVDGRAFALSLQGAGNKNGCIMVVGQGKIQHRAYIAYIFRDQEIAYFEQGGVFRLFLFWLFIRDKTQKRQIKFFFQIFRRFNALIQKPINVVPESKIVVRFWLIGIILAVITIVTLKMR